MKFLALILLSSYPLLADESFLKIKNEIISLHESIKKESSPQAKADYHYQLALAYFKDQELSLAFKHFLMAIDLHPKKEKKEMSAEEKAVYEEALQFYLVECCLDPAKTAVQLLSKYGAVAKEHPEYNQLNFLLSTAYGNSGEFDLFFEQFYQHYPYCADSFLVSKTKGIINLRLSAQEKEDKMRQQYHASAVKELEHALEQNPLDGNLYKILISLSKDAKDAKKELLYLSKLATSNPKIPRGDIPLYVREAVELNDKALAQKIIEGGKRHYEYSKAIQEAEKYLNQQK